MSNGPRSLKSFIAVAWTDGYMRGDYDEEVYPRAIQQFIQSESAEWVKHLPDMYKLTSGAWALILPSPDPKLDVSVVNPLTEEFFLVVRPAFKEITDEYIKGVEQMVSRAQFAMLEEQGRLPPLDEQEFN